MTALTTPRHRVSAATAQMRGVADSVTEASVWSMTAAEAATTLVQLGRLRAQVDELEARVAAHADDINLGEETGSSSAANWLAHQTRQTRMTAHSTVRLGHDLDAHPLTRDALAADDLLTDQARVILRAVDALPDHLDAALVAKAEAHLIGEAAHHDAKALRIIGRRLLEVVAPEEADAHEARLLQREETEAAAACRLTLSDDRHGQVHGRFTLPTYHGAALRKMLTALAAPKHRNPRPRRRTAARAAAAGPGTVRTHRALPHRQTPEGRRRHRHPGHHHGPPGAHR